MSKKKDYTEKDVLKVSGSVNPLFNAQEIAIIGSAVNRNADVLIEVMQKLEKLEREVMYANGK